jgi:predicted CoA-binding protein
MICSTLAALFSGFIPLFCALLPAIGLNDSVDMLDLLPKQQQMPAIVEEAPQEVPDLFLQLGTVNVNIAGDSNVVSVEKVGNS